MFDTHKNTIIAGFVVWLILLIVGFELIIGDPGGTGPTLQAVPRSLDELLAPDLLAGLAGWTMAGRPRPARRGPGGPRAACPSSAAWSTVASTSSGPSWSADARAATPATSAGSSPSSPSC